MHVEGGRKGGREEGKEGEGGREGGKDKDIIETFLFRMK